MHENGDTGHRTPDMLPLTLGPLDGAGFANVMANACINAGEEMDNTDHGTVEQSTYSGR